MKKKITFSLIALFLSSFVVHLSAQIPTVYSLENTGADIERSATVMPSLRNCPVIVPLPDPFAWSADPLGMEPVRSTSFEDWQTHRQEFLDMFQHYEIGTKPTVSPEQIVASFEDNVLKVIVTVGDNSLTLTSTVSFPEDGVSPYPLVIGMNSSYGSMPSAQFISRGIAGMGFKHNEVTVYGGPSNSDPFFVLYPQQNTENTGQYAAWSWGISRLIDGLYQLNGVLGDKAVDLEKIAVTGCSYAGKMALFAGAFDERIALTISQESGGGGATSWRYSATQDGVEGLAQTDSKWFKDSMFDFGNNNVWKIPTDHHLLTALVAPRALFVTGNTDYQWLSNMSCYVNSKATAEIYNTLGIADRFGYLVDGGHSHCAYPTEQLDALTYFIDRFMKGDSDLSQNIAIYPEEYNTTVEAEKWYEWWGTGEPTPPVDIDETTEYEGNHTLYIFKLPYLPVIDGDIENDDAWDAFPWIAVNKDKSITNGTSDAAAKYKIGYTNDSLYIAVSIEDATPFYNTDISSYLRDCNEIFISLDTITRSVITGGSTQYRVTRGGAYDASTVAINYHVVSDDNGWIVEWALPWTGIANRESYDLSSIDEKEYPFIRFDMAVADNTDGTANGRTQMLFWNAATDNQYNSMNNLGYIKLMGDLPPMIGTNTVLDIYKLQTLPTIDGDVLDEAWSTISWVDAYKNKPITDGTATFGSTTEFKVGYSNDSLYIALRVKDNTPHNEPDISTYIRDCNELFINMDTTTIVGTNGRNQYRLQRDNSALETAISRNAVNAIAKPVFGEDGVSDIGWTAEWALPWDKIAQRESMAFTTIDEKEYPYVRFELVVADNTNGKSNGRTQMMFWNAATDDQYGGMTNMGYLRLNTSDPTGFNEVIKPALSAYYNAATDILVFMNAVNDVSIYTVTGELVFKTQLRSERGSLNVSFLNKGLYIVRASGYSAFKFIK